MADFRGDGTTIKHTPGSAVTGGDVILSGDKIGVAKNDIAATVEGVLNVMGEYRFPKTAATVYAIGVKVYWDVADQEATEDADSGTNKLIGYVTVAAASADTTVDCMLVNDVS